MGAKEFEVFVPALRTMGNIATTNDTSIIERCLWHGVIDKLYDLLQSSNSNIIKESLWTLSNICASCQTHISSLVNSDIYDRVISLLHSTNLDIKKEALWVIANSITGADLNLRTDILKKGSSNLMAGLV